MWHEYKGFKFKMVSEGKWQIRLPSGMKSVIDAADENEVKQKIDGLGG